MRPADHDDFYGACIQACTDAPVGAGGPNALVCVDDDEDGLLVMSIEVGADQGEAMRRIRDLFDDGARHDYAGFATLTSWSPDDVTPFFDAWCLTTLRRDDMGRIAMVKCGTRQVWRMDTIEGPWFALSTLGSMRGWLDGRFTELKSVKDERLYGTVFDATPPEDQRGRI